MYNSLSGYLGKNKSDPIQECYTYFYYGQNSCNYSDSENDHSPNQAIISIAQHIAFHYSSCRCRVRQNNLMVI